MGPSRALATMPLLKRSACFGWRDDFADGSNKGIVEGALNDPMIAPMKALMRALRMAPMTAPQEG